MSIQSDLINIEIMDDDGEVASANFIEFINPDIIFNFVKQR